MCTAGGSGWAARPGCLTLSTKGRAAGSRALHASCCICRCCPPCCWLASPLCLLQSLTPTINQVKKQLGQVDLTGTAISSSSGTGSSQQQLAGEGTPLTASEAAVRDVGVSRRQADAQRWIAAWRFRSRGNKKAAAAAAAAAEDGAVERGAARLAQVGWPGGASRLAAAQPGLLASRNGGCAQHCPRF